MSKNKTKKTILSESEVKDNMIEGYDLKWIEEVGELHPDYFKVINKKSLDEIRDEQS